MESNEPNGGCGGQDFATFAIGFVLGALVAGVALVAWACGGGERW